MPTAETTSCSTERPAFAALKRLGCEHIVVQQVALGEVRLAEWNHQVFSDDLAGLLDVVRQMEGIEVSRVATPRSGELILPGGETWSLTFDSKGDFASALARLADTCAGLGTIVRTTVRPDPEDGVVVVYPKFTIKDVLAAAASGHLLPAGVTRFIVPGRVIRLDCPLDLLHFAESTALKQRRLDNLIRTRLRAGAVRRYDEAVILLDEA